MLANLSHDHDQPTHLHRQNSPEDEVLRVIRFGAPETRYCPAGVYELSGSVVRINAQNCLHCKACELNDPEHSLPGTPPEGGSGPSTAHDVRCPLAPCRRVRRGAFSRHTQFRNIS